MKESQTHRPTDDDDNDPIETSDSEKIAIMAVVWDAEEQIRSGVELRRVLVNSFTAIFLHGRDKVGAEERERLRTALRNAAIRLDEIYECAAHPADAGRWAALAWEALSPIPIGTEVDYWLGDREGLPSGRGKTRSEVEALGAVAVVWIEGCSGCVAITHVEPVKK